MKLPLVDQPGPLGKNQSLEIALNQVSSISEEELIKKAYSHVLEVVSRMMTPEEYAANGATALREKYLYPIWPELKH